MKNILLILATLFLFSCGQQEKEAPKPFKIEKPGISYSEYLGQVKAKQEELSKRYTQGDSDAKKAVVKEACDYLFKAISEDIFGYWHGTKWDFNGTTRTPGEGTIACGYFVTNVLSDVGFDIPRVKWAQSASEVFIVELADEGVKRTSGAPMSEIRAYLEESGEGLYLAGLDSHVGFILVKEKHMRFIHSNYYSPTNGVSFEELETKNPLNDSAYRVIGKLLSEKMVTKWLVGEAY